MPRARRAMRRRRVARVAVGSAVMAGTAGAVHHHQNQKWAAQDAQRAAVRRKRNIIQRKSTRTRLRRRAPASDLTAQLQQLSQLHNAGVLSDEEFAAAKGKLLAG